MDNVIAGYSKKLEREERRSWEQTRMVMHTLLTPHLKKGKNLKLQDVLPLPWDVQNDSELMEEKDAVQLLKEQQAYWDEIDKKRKKQ